MYKNTDNSTLPKVLTIVLTTKNTDNSTHYKSTDNSAYYKNTDNSAHYKKILTNVHTIQNTTYYSSPYSRNVWTNNGN